MSVNYVLYVSTAAVHFSQANLVELLIHARAKNEPRNLSGMLLFRADTFIQWLEGSSDQIEPVVAKIKRDRRHVNFRLLAEGTLPARAFPEWSMGFKNLTGLREDSLTGYSELLQAKSAIPKTNFAAKRLLETLNDVILESADL